MLDTNARPGPVVGVLRGRWVVANDNADVLVFMFDGRLV
jgi:hypothetical protein